MGKIAKLLVDQGLYDSIEITPDDLDELTKYLSYDRNRDAKLEVYCPYCKTDRVFRIADEYSDVLVDLSPKANVGYNRQVTYSKGDLFGRCLNRSYSLTFLCSFDSKHELLFNLVADEHSIMKVGQFPSIADLASSKTAQYRSVLGEQYTEYNRAIGLFAHGVGIGSFVYLRRIIERLVFNKFKETSNELKVTEEDFKVMGFEQKIDLLKRHLPKVLVENKNIYGIISSGIHELSEDKCLSMFPIVRKGIDMILDDVLSEKKREGNEAELKQFVADATGELRKNK